METKELFKYTPTKMYTDKGWEGYEYHNKTKENSVAAAIIFLTLYSCIAGLLCSWNIFL